MRLIDADAMLDDVLRQNETIKALGIEELTKMSLTICDGIKQEICNQPTIDAVEVVRCKDCVRGITEFDGKYCNGVFHSMDFFCADGERKDDEH